MTLLRDFTTQTNQKFTITPAVKFYQYKDTAIGNKVYTDDSAAYPFSVTNVTKQVKNSEPFQGGLTIWTPDDTDQDAPFVGTSSRPYTLLTASSTNGTATISVGSWDLTYRKFLTFVVRKTSTTMTTGTIRALSGVGDLAQQAFDITSLSAGDYQRLTIDVSDATLQSGSFDISAVTDVEIEIDVSGEALEIGMIYAVSDRLMTIGGIIDLQFNCIGELSIENTIETADKVCKNLARDVFGTGRTDTITVTTPNVNLLGYALAAGKVPKNELFETITTVNSSSVVGRAISTNTITLPADLTIWTVTVDGVTYQDGSSVGLTASTLTPGYYHYNSSSGLMTFATGLNTKIPVVQAINNTQVPHFDSVGLDTGYEGVLYLVLESSDGRQKIIKVPRAKLVQANDTFNTDNNDTVEYSIRFLASDEDIVYTTAIT